MHEVRFAGEIKHLEGDIVTEDGISLEPSVHCSNPKMPGCEIFSFEAVFSNGPADLVRHHVSLGRAALGSSVGLAEDVDSKDSVANGYGEDEVENQRMSCVGPPQSRSSKLSHYFLYLSFFNQHRQKWREMIKFLSLILSYYNSLLAQPPDVEEENENIVKKKI